MNQSNFFNLNWGDVLRGLIVAVLSGIALPLLAVIQTPDFSIAMVNWNQVLVLAANGGLAAMAAYLTKNLFTDSAGKFAGKIG
jgi:hypothetical protein